MQRASVRTPAYAPIVRADLWHPIGAVPPAALHEARLQLHHAAQIANSVGISLLPPAADDSHSAFEWSDGEEGLLTPVIPCTRAFRVGLRLPDLSLRVLEPDGKRRESFHLSGSTMDDGFRWLVAQVKAAGADASRMTMKKHYEIPVHGVASGEPFALHDGAGVAELARYYSDAARVLRPLVDKNTNASAIRCWPHHFDLATLITLPGTPTRTIGVGLSPGDGSYDEPYFYVGPYPYPTVDALPPLDGPAHWHTTGWTGAVLTATDLIRSAKQASQEVIARAYVDDAIRACERALRTTS